MKIKFLLIIFYIIFWLNSNLLSDENSKILKVGLLAPLSGKYAELGNSFLYSLQLALEEINDENIFILPIRKKKLVIWIISLPFFCSSNNLRHS